MKSVLMIALVAFLMGACGGQEKAKNNDLIKVDRTNYSISFPKSWNPATSENPTVDLLMKTPAESATDRFMENVNILIQDIGTTEVTLQQYADLSEDQLKRIINSSQVIEKKIFKHNGIECLELGYSANQGEFQLAYKQRVYLHKGKAYVLTFTAEQASYKHFEKEVNAVFESFQLK